MRPAGLRSLRHLASPLPTPFIRRTAPTPIPRVHSRAFQTSPRCRQQDDVIIVKRPFFTRRKFALVLAHGLCIYACWRFLIWKLDLVLGDVEDIEPVEGEDGSLFIPLSFPKILPQEFYKATDPEWQEFVKFSKDPKRKKGIREELANRVLSDIAKHPKTQMMLGKNIRVTKHWFEIKFPDGPAPEYARLALEFTDEIIALSDQPIDNAHFISLSNVMRPRAAWAAVKNTAWMLYTIHKARAKSYLGMSLDAQEQQAALLYRLVTQASQAMELKEALEAQKKALESTVQSQSKAIDQLLGKDTTKSPSHPPSTAKPVRDSQPAERRSTSFPPIISSNVWDRINSTFNPFASSSSTSATTSSARSSSSPSASGDMEYTLPFSIPIPPSMTIAMDTFNATMALALFQTRTDPHPPGAFHIFGELEVRGETAKAKCDVKAAYDPKASKFVWVTCSIKHLWEVKQRPKGGS